MENNGITESEKLHKKLNELARSFKITGLTDELRLKLEFSKCFEKLYIQSAKDSYYWQYCPLKVYKENINQLEAKFIEKSPDALKLDFWMHEVNKLYDYYKDEGDAELIDEIVTLPAGYVYNPNSMYEIILNFLTDEMLKNIDYSTKRKITFLESQIFPEPTKYIRLSNGQYLILDNTNLERLHSGKVSDKIKYATEEQKNMFYQKNSGLTKIEKEVTSDPEPETFLDYSNNPQKEKIVFLHELGILDYLQEKMNNESVNFSANKLAEVISTFTCIDQPTAQSYLNPIFSEYAKQKNNPLTSKTLERVKNKLKDIGFNTTKTT